MKKVFQSKIWHISVNIPISLNPKFKKNEFCWCELHLNKDIILKN